MEDINKRSLFFNAPGFKNQEIEVAPEIDPIKSKRKPMIDEEVSSCEIVWIRCAHLVVGFLFGSKFV